MENFLQQLLNGITWGGIYALIALGYTMVYGVLKLINFAHGDVYMVGAMTASTWPTPWVSPLTPPWSACWSRSCVRWRCARCLAR